MEKQERKSLLDTCVKHLNYEREDLATYDGRQRRDRQPLFTPVAFSRYTRTEALGRPLIPHLWYEGELACLFGEPNVGKTTLARQIMLEITENTQHSVIYFDLENNESTVPPTAANAATVPPPLMHGRPMARVLSHPSINTPKEVTVHRPG